jgi:hypothetical protein
VFSSTVQEGLSNTAKAPRLASIWTDRHVNPVTVCAFSAVVTLHKSSVIFCQTGYGAHPASNPLPDPKYLHFPIRLFLFVNSQVARPPATAQATCFPLSRWHQILYPAPPLLTFLSPLQLPPAALCSLQPRTLPVDARSALGRCPTARKRLQFAYLCLI